MTKEGINLKIPGNNDARGDLRSRLGRLMNQDFRALFFHRKMTLGHRLRLLCGGPRRFLLRLLRPKYVQAQLEKRQGACKRCGACCQMSWRCPHLFYDENGLASCHLYGKGRASWCRDFPIDERCLADRDSIGFKEPCGLWWKNS